MHTYIYIFICIHTHGASGRPEAPSNFSGTSQSDLGATYDIFGPSLKLLGGLGSVLGHLKRFLRCMWGVLGAFRDVSTMKGPKETMALYFCSGPLGPTVAAILKKCLMCFEALHAMKVNDVSKAHEAINS